MTIDVDREIEAILQQLQLKMREAGFSQTAIQNAVGWKGSYISQLFNRTKSLRVEQLLKILSVIDLPVWQFFLELSAVTEPKESYSRLTNFELARKMRESLENLGESLERLITTAEDHAQKNSSC